MSRYRHLWPAVSILFLVVACTAVDLRGATSLWGVGLRQHATQLTFEDYPFSDKDMSYSLLYQYHDLEGYWQLGLNYTPNIDGTNQIEQALTPEIDLIMTENNWRLGAGVLKSSLRSDDGTREWTDVYWQFIVGYRVKLAGINLDLSVFYPFPEFNKLGDFDASDLEYGASAVFRF